MGTDILYLEKSNLLAQRLINIIPEVQWLLIHDENVFLETILKEKPLLIIVGDTGSSAIVELLFSLKSIAGINNIPVIFYGEDEYLNILPVKIKITRKDDDPRKQTREKNAILNLIKSEKKLRSTESFKWALPKNYKDPDFYRIRSRAILYEELFKGYLCNEISGINIVDISFKEVLEKFCSQIETLLLIDFITVIYLEDSNFTDETPTGILHLRQGIPSGIISQLSEYALSLLDPNYTITGAELDVKIGNRPPILNIEFNDINFVFNQKLKITGLKSAIMIMGNYDKKEKHPCDLPKDLSVRVLEHSHDLIEKAYRYYAKVDENQIIFKAFCQFLPAPIINDLLLKESEKALLTGQKRKVVILFSHIHHFDQIVESNEPQRVVDFLNSHFSRMVKIIQSYGGTIDKFIGDAIFAIFGAPISYMDNAQRAANAAVDMIKEFNNTSLENMSLPIVGVSTGVGLNEGEAIIGNIGCSDKFDYTAIGDTVNLAARLESLTKHYKQDILMSKIVADSIAKNSYCRLIDRAKVKGKNKPTEIYSLIVKPERYTDEWKMLYNRGFKMYTLGNWYTAAEYFTAALELISYDPVCRILLSRCMEYQEKEPEDWSGAVALDFK